MNTTIDFLSQHWAVLASSATAGLFINAAVKNLPPPPVGSIWYKWFYDTIQDYIAVRSGRPTTPETPAQTK